MDLSGELTGEGAQPRIRYARHVHLAGERLQQRIERSAVAAKEAAYERRHRRTLIPENDGEGISGRGLLQLVLTHSD